MNLDFSFYNWDLISNFVLKGLYFSLMLTLVATIGGVLFGTVLALMRLSGRKWLDVSAGHGDSVVLPAGARHHRPPHWR